MLSSKNKPLRLLRPGAKKWELWNLHQDQKPELVLTAEKLTDIRYTPNTILGFPVAATFHIPLWLVRTEQEFLPELISTQLEKRGLLHGSTEQTVTGTDICAVSQTHTLFRITVLPHDIDASLSITWPDHFDLAARYLPFYGDSIVLWRELETLCTAFVRNSKPVHFQCLENNKITQSCLEEIYLLLLSLESQAVVVPPSKIYLWGDFSTEEQQLAKNSFWGETIIQPLPTPIKAITILNLIPPSIAQFKKDLQRRARRKKTALLAAALYLALFAFLGIYVILLNTQKNLLASELDANSEEIDRITETKTLWNSIEPIIDPAFSPLEILYQTARMLPEEGVRFTSFEMDSASITILGEASSFPDASTFIQNVKENPNLAFYSWEEPTPTLLPNNKAQFQLLGKLMYATFDKQ